ncbi:MAG: hypothetical protein BRD23_09035 [Halobacteriales archaeon SW_9_67_25]|jgi:VIT1/CCC1 family predicted Fe2+/Mn2+ transporter|nr:MAG: hypothetical protein BRD23_09035 [Halobacteriales archaeon SW_9_67_25]
MATLHREEVTSIVVVGTILAVFAWYGSEMSGIQRLTNSVIVSLVGIASATAGFYVLNRWNPGWYRS